MDNWAKDKRLLSKILDLDEALRSELLTRIERADPAQSERIKTMLKAEQSLGEFLEEAPVLKWDHGAQMPQPGDELGSYRVSSELATGGMATVYLATRNDEAFEKTVAIKVVRPRRTAPLDLQALFARERRILARLEHPNIVRVIDAGAAPSGLQYLVMEYCDGEPVDRYCDGQKLNVRERIELFLEIARTVTFAHNHLVVHSDLKPSNILVDSAGRPRLLDFGVAQLLQSDGPAQQVERSNDAAQADDSARVHAMTPEFASPEQDQEAASVQSDVYSLGVLLYRMLCGCRPYASLHDQETPTTLAFREACRNESPLAASESMTKQGVETRHRIARNRASSPGALVSKLKGALDAVLLRALAKNANERYQSVGDLAEDLERVLEHRVPSGHHPSWVERWRLAVKRSPGGATAAFMGTVLLIALALFTWRLSLERDRVDEERAYAEDLADVSVGLFGAVDSFEVGDQSALDVVLAASEKVRSQQLAPEVEARNRLVIGKLLSQLGAFSESLEEFKRVEELRTQTLGATHRRTIESTLDLAAALRKVRDLEQAEVVVERAHQAAVAHLAATDPLLGQAFMSVARTKIKQSIMDPNITPLFTSAITIFEQANDAAAVAQAKRDFGQYKFHMGDRDGGLALLDQAIDLTRARVGDRHLELASALHNRSALLASAGRYAEMEAAAREALDIKVAILGEEHSLSQNSENMVAMALGITGRFRECLEVWNRLIKRAQEREPKGFFQTYGLILVATAHAELGEGTLAREVLDSLGDSVNAPSVGGMSDFAMALVEISEGAPADAAIRLEQLLAERRTEFAENDGMITSVEVTLGEALFDAGQLLEARDYLVAALASIEATEVEEAVIEPLIALARLKLQTGETEAAQQDLQRARGILESSGMPRQSWFWGALEGLEASSRNDHVGVQEAVNALTRTAGPSAIETQRARRLLN